MEAVREEEEPAKLLQLQPEGETPELPQRQRTASPITPLSPSYQGGARGRGARLDWDSLLSFSDISGPKSYN